MVYSLIFLKQLNFQEKYIIIITIVKLNNSLFMIFLNKFNTCVILLVLHLSLKAV